MLKLLTKIFIKNPDDVRDPAVRGAYGKLCGAYGIFLNFLLAGAKYFAGAMSGSVAIIADAFNNLTDAGSSVISLIGFALSEKAPDKEHPYGHGRIEYLAGLGLSVVIILVGVELAESSFNKILHPEPVALGLLPAGILLLSILVKLYMAAYNRSIGKKINSSAMLAAAADSMSDSIATGVVILSMVVAYFFKVNIDGYAGLAVAIFIFFAGIGAAKDTLSPLLGKAPDAEFVQDIEKTVSAYPEVVGIHDLMVHDYGPGRVIVSLHAEVDGSGDIYRLHDAIDRAEMEIKERFGCLATIHMDPIDANDSETGRIRQLLQEKLRELYPEISIHDLRIVPGPTHKNLIFDAALPQTVKERDSVIDERIRALVNDSWPECFAVVNIDREYV